MSRQRSDAVLADVSMIDRCCEWRGNQQRVQNSRYSTCSMKMVPSDPTAGFRAKFSVASTVTLPRVP